MNIYWKKYHMKLYEVWKNSKWENVSNILKNTYYLEENKKDCLDIYENIYNKFFMPC